MNKPNLHFIARIWKPLLGVATILFLIVWSTGALREKTPPGVVEHLAGIEIPAGAETHTVRREPIPARISVAGTVTSEETILVSARVAGVVDAVMVSAGDRVVKGQPLLKIDDREIREKIAAADAQLRRADSEFQRMKKLFAAQAATQQQWNEAEATFHTARANREQWAVVLTFHEILSPIDGVITDRRIETGDLAAPGAILLSVYNPDAMRLDVPVPVRLIDLIAIGAVLPVSLNRSGEMIEGIVSEFVSEIDPASRTQVVRIQLKGQTPLPGMFGRLWIDFEPHDGYRLPVTSVFRVGQLEMVQVVRDQRAVRRLVRTGPVDRDQVEVLSGIEEGDVVLVQPVPGN